MSKEELRVNSVEELLGAVPRLMGHNPSVGAAVIGLGHSPIHGFIPYDPDVWATLCQDVAGAMSRHLVTEVAVIGYDLGAEGTAVLNVALAAYRLTVNAQVAVVGDDWMELVTGQRGHVPLDLLAAPTREDLASSVTPLDPWVLVADPRPTQEASPDLLSVLIEPEGRDAFVLACASSGGMEAFHGWRLAVIEAVRHAPAEYRDQAYTSAALVAWLAGDGTRVNLLLDQVVTPTTLSTTLVESLRLAANPQDFLDAMLAAWELG